jgi:hypothetical protein
MNVTAVTAYTAPMWTGLRDLINDVESGGAAYTDVLVYDVSRWADSRM